MPSINLPLHPCHLQWFTTTTLVSTPWNLNSLTGEYFLGMEACFSSCRKNKRIQELLLPKAILHRWWKENSFLKYPFSEPFHWGNWALLCMASLWSPEGWNPADRSSYWLDNNKFTSFSVWKTHFQPNQLHFIPNLCLSGGSTKITKIILDKWIRSHKQASLYVHTQVSLGFGISTRELFNFSLS